GRLPLDPAAPANNGTGATRTTINNRAGTANGDVMIAGIHVRGQGSSATVPPPLGWVLIRRTNVGDLTGTTGSLLSYYKVAGGSEPISYIWTFDTNRRARGGACVHTALITSRAPS